MTKSNWQAERIRQASEHQELVFAAEVNNLNLVGRNGRQLKLSDGRHMVEFVSCSYLGLENHPDLAKAAVDAINKYGIQFAAARTRIKPEFYDELDQRLSEIFAGSHITTFNAVSPCHSAVFPLLASGELPGFPISGDPVFLMDRTSHASIQINRGLLSQFGHVQRLDFTQQDELEEVCFNIASNGQTPIMISDSVGSMGGVLPITFILDLADRFGGYAYLDDAHGTSVFGTRGQGYVLEQTHDVFPDRLILVGSLSKAFGAHGGFVATKTKATTDFIRRFGSTYVFGGPPSLPGLAACLASARLHLNGEVQRRQNELRTNLQRFDELFGNCINAGSFMPIRGIYVGDETTAIEQCASMQKHNFTMTVAMYPTVSKGRAILRCALSSDHTIKQIDGLAENYFEFAAPQGLVA